MVIQYSASELKYGTKAKVANELKQASDAAFKAPERPAVSDGETKTVSHSVFEYAAN